MRKRIPFFILIVFSTLFMLSFYNDVILHPNQHLFGNDGDAIKNYFTYCFHIAHDTSYVEFEGMNYPYGENFLYTDCHPVLADAFKLLSSKFSFFNSHSIGILNFIMMLSIFLTFIVCYFLLKEFNVNNWLSLIYCIGITILAPQLFRLGGHLALSYSVAIPLSWLLLIRTLKNINRPYNLIILFINNLFWLFIHAYLGVIILFFLACIVVVTFISDANRRKETWHYLRIISAVLVPVIMFYLFTVLTDTHVGRTENPSGFFLYNAEFDDVFLPNHQPLRPLFDKLSGNTIKLEWEAWSYVGFSTTILFLVMLVLFIIKLFKWNKPSHLNQIFTSRYLNISIISAAIVLLFAMAFPFKQIHGLIDILPFVKQFRATGRFTWPFYFVATVFLANVMQEMYTRTSKQPQKTGVILLCIIIGVFNVIEGIPYHKDASNSITKSKNLFAKELLPASYLNAIKSINTSDYQAIITLPFYYQGSESYSRPRNDETARASMVISYHTGLPIMCANLTRTSIQESKNIVQVVSPDFYKKEILKDLPGNKPFLVIRTTAIITSYEEDIFKKCKPVYVNDELSIYSLQKEDLFKSSARTIFNTYKQIEPSLFKRDQFYLSTDSTFIYFNGFESLKSEKPFRGKGCFQSIKKGKNTFAEFAPNTFSAGKKYHVSVWMFNGQNDALNDWFRFIIEEFDEEKNTWQSTTYFPEQSEVLKGDWSLIEGTFEVKNPKSKVYIVTKGKDESKGPLFVDDLLIKEYGVDVYSLNKKEDTLFYNNHEVIIE